MTHERPPTDDEIGRRLGDLFRVLGPLYRLAARRVADDEEIEGVTTGVRAVLERVHVDGPAPVPVIGRALGTSRQWVQRMANEGRRQGLVDLVGNPNHRRSPLVTLTPEGRRAISRIRAREEAAMARLGDGLDADEVDVCIHVLEHLRRGLDATTREREAAPGASGGSDAG